MSCVSECECEQWNALETADEIATEVRWLTSFLIAQLWRHEGTVVFVPTYNVKDRGELLAKLKEFHDEGYVSFFLIGSKHVTLQRSILISIFSLQPSRRKEPSSFLDSFLCSLFFPFSLFWISVSSFCFSFVFFFLFLGKIGMVGWAWSSCASRTLELNPTWTSYWRKDLSYN